MVASKSKRRDRQVVRILGILGTLLEGSRVSIQDLAAKYGTRRETIYRDIRALEDAGYPITGDDRGRLSHPHLLPEAGRRSPHLRLTDPEVAAVLWAWKQTKSNSPFREALGSAGAKLRAMAASNEGSLASGVEAAMVDRDSFGSENSPRQEIVLELVEGIVTHKACEVEYQSPARRSAKKYQYHPYRLLTVADSLYCIGKVPPHDNVTTLAVNRICALSLLDAGFEVDQAFDFERYRRECFGIVWEKPMDITIRFSALQAPYIRERIWHATQRLCELPDGRLDLSFRAGGTFEIVRWVLGWGEAAEVVSPEALRRQVADTLSRAAKSYSKSSGRRSH
jgi:predicted DNA-binding transcriptional regulator YafY